MRFRMYVFIIVGALICFSLILLRDVWWDWRSQVYKAQCEAKSGAFVYQTRFGECFKDGKYIPHSFTE